MAIPEESPRLTYTGSGTRGPFTLAVDGTPITYADSSHIVVTRYDSDDTPTLLVEGADYDLSADSVLPDTNGNVALAADVTLRASADVLAVDEHLVLERVTPKEQDLVKAGISGDTLMAALDAATRMIQELYAALARTVAIAALDTGPLVLPSLADLEGMVVGVVDGELAAISGGNAGWSPVLAVVTDSARRVLQVADWTGGEGTKPATGSYIGASGLVSLIASAVDIRGATGANGNGSGDVIAANNGTEFTAATFASNLGLLRAANNLSDIISASAARTNLGLTSTATTALASLLLAANNLSDLANAATARTNLGVPLATAADILAKTAGKVLTADKIFDAAVPLTLTDGATITIDMALGFNFEVTLGGNRTFANPSNIEVGQSGVIYITQDGTGSRTATWGSKFKWAGATAGVLSTAVASVDRVTYYVRSATWIDLDISKNRG